MLKPWGVRVKTMAVEEASKPRPIAPEEAPTWVGLHSARPGGDKSHGPCGFAVQGPVVLIGTPEDNALIKFALEEGFLPYAPTRRTSPAAARDDRVAARLRGPQAGVGRAHRLRRRRDLRSRGHALRDGRRPRAADGARAARDVDGRRREQGAREDRGGGRRLEAALPDRAVAWRRREVLLALTEDGSLTALDGQGKVQWQKSFDAGETLALDVSEKLIVVGATHHVLGFDGSGQAGLRRPGSVGHLRGGLARTASRRLRHGRRKALARRRRRQGHRDVGGGDAKNPEALRGGDVRADGKTLVALTAQEAHVIADGKVAHRMGGIGGRVRPVREGDAVLVPDGHEKVLVVADGKPGAAISVAKTGVVSVSGAAAGTEMDGGVRFLKDGKVAWEHKATRKLTKRVAANGDRVAVAYWGGTVAVLEGGALKSSQAFPYDVADLAWSNGKLVVGLTDGRLFGLDVK
jgi:hypothetical protein